MILDISWTPGELAPSSSLTVSKSDLFTVLSMIPYLDEFGFLLVTTMKSKYCTKVSADVGTGVAVPNRIPRFERLRGTQQADTSHS